MKVLFLTQTSQIGASARYRVYQYLDYLSESGIDYTISAAVSDNILKNYLELDKSFTKFQFYMSQFFKRITEITKANKFDIIFLQRDIIVHFYPILERLLVSFNKNIIFDFDDVLYLYPSGKTPKFLFRLLWDKEKIARIIKLSKHVIAGNEFLRGYATRFTKNVTVIPTSIDLSLYNLNIQPRPMAERTVIGWIGSQGTFNYLKNIFPLFVEMAKKYNIELKVVGARGPQINGLKISYKDWSLDTEINDIYSFDIGVMPLLNDEWSQGKSATKLLQYMAAGVPAVASCVGVNKEIVQDGVNGFLAGSHNEWIEKISCLIDNKTFSGKMCQEARKTIERHYSTEVNAPKLIKVIKGVLGKT